LIDGKVLKLAGFDMGRNYVAWATVRGTFNSGFHLHRHGFLFPPELGSTYEFGSTLNKWSNIFSWFVVKDLNADAWAAERFVYRPGGQGSGAEDICLRLGAMGVPSDGHMVRNTDWKSWFKRSVSPNGTQAFFCTPTEHEADAAGIALYLGSIILPRMTDKSPSQ
jgi:hypothetical protein